MTPQELGLPIGTVARVTPDVNGNRAVTTDGVDITDKLQKVAFVLKNAIKNGGFIRLDVNKTGQATWRYTTQSEFEQSTHTKNSDMNIVNDVVLTTLSDEQIREMVANSDSLKPDKLRIDPIWWRFAIRTALRGNNLLVVGPSGCGKGLLASSVKKALGRDDKFFYVNLGATQDARSTLIGNTHFDKTAGTFLAQSYFCNAIQVPNALILLDEASRASFDAQNILMSVLDPTQRYLRIDEDKNSREIRVAPGVTFLLTANVGSEYSATKTLDRAFQDRCYIIEMQPLSQEQEYANLKYVFPDIDDTTLLAISKIADATRQEIRSETAKIDTIISTRQTELMCGLIRDGFTLAEAAEVSIYPFFSDMGGSDTPRAFVRAVVQKYLKPEDPSQAAPQIDPNDPNGGRAVPW